MYSLIQAKRVRGSDGQPIPAVWKSLEAAGIVFRLGQLVHCIAAGPGTGKERPDPDPGYHVPDVGAVPVRR